MARGERHRAGNAATHERLNEFLGILALALGALVAVSLTSFNPSDRSWFVEPARSLGPTRNLAGEFGALVASVLLTLLGVVAYAAPLGLGVFGWRRFRNRAAAPRRGRLLSFALLGASLTGLLSFSLGDLLFTSASRGSEAFRVSTGGLLGHGVATLAHRFLGPAGGFIALLGLVVASLVLATHLSLGRLAQAVARAVAGLGRRLRTAVVRFSEQRRKSRTRREVVTRVAADALAERAASKARTPIVVPSEPAAAAAPEPPAPALAPLAADAAAPTLARPRQPSPPTPLIEHGAAPTAPLATSPRAPDPAPTRPLRAPVAPTPRLVDDDLDLVAADLAGALDQEPSAARRSRPRKLDKAPLPAELGALPLNPEPLPPPPRLDDDPPAAPTTRVIRDKKAAASKRPPEGDYRLPELDLLERMENPVGVNDQELLENAKVLVSKLKEFAVEGSVQQIHPGPVVTTYEFRPEAGVKYSKITGLSDDLCLALRAEAIRIDRISGKSAVGIEVPNQHRELIGLREILESEAFTQSSSKITLALGKLINGDTYATDLRKMPHLLIAGATGAGKSVAVNCMIVSILYKATPDEVKFIMVDPKRIELGVYDEIPHLLVPVVTDCKLASNALRWATAEMEARYRRLASYGVRNIEQFNLYLKTPEARALYDDPEHPDLKPLPYIVIIIDELADLMAIAQNDVEDSISRLAAMARAVGIHLILATQRPSVDVITGVIKANFPSRISFRVSSKVDSRTVLDSNGAEQLLGKGDMLFMPPGSARLVRIHGPFISDQEVGRLVATLKKRARPQFNEEILRCGEEAAQGGIDGPMDDMYEEAVRVVLETGQASVSHLQRRLRLGYSRAARLVDMMELNGIVGPKDGARGREILVDASYLAQMRDAPEASVMGGPPSTVR